MGELLNSTTPYQMKMDIGFSDLQRIASSGPSRQLHHFCFHPLCPLPTDKPFRVPREWREAPKQEADHLRALHLGHHFH